MNSETKVCQSCKNNFTIEPEDFEFYKKMEVPPPTWCWRCRAMRRLSYRNIRYLYERMCDATGKKIFIPMPPSAPMPVYDQEYWRSDKWDPMTYGKEYDFSRPFFDQISELFNSVPWNYLWQRDTKNSDYCMAAWANNCYLCFDAGYIEDCGYSVTPQRCKQVFDIINCEQCELCYYSINLHSSFKVFFSKTCVSCSELWFCQDCVGCTSCVGCTNLRNKSYYIYNESYTKEAYAEKLKEMKLDSWSGVQKVREEAMKNWLKYPVKFQHSVQAKDCEGDYIYKATEIRNCFFCGNSQNCAHSQSIIYGPIKDCMDTTSSGLTAELDYEIICCGEKVIRTAFSFDLASVMDSRYAINCKQCSYLFGCVGLRNKKYCIFNKQYSKEEYEALVSKIIKHMNEMPYVDGKGRTYTYGEFFPPERSPFGYNESQGQEYFPLSEKEAKEKGFTWRIPDARNYSITKKSGDLSDSISDIPDSITQEVIQCMHDEKNSHSEECATNCATAFRITSQELRVYRQMGVPLPRLCFNCRHVDRVSWRNKPELFARECMCKEGGHGHASPCPNKFKTTYSPDRPEIVYCEECYQKEVI